jgi:mono/diheme cytochrome c family protein
MIAMLKALAVLVALIALLGTAAFIWIGSRGVSARAEPGRIETAVARTMRRLAIPRSGRERRNPVAATPEAIAAGMSHYADHCAGCHANDGSGETELGLGLYPRPPDMRQDATQNLSDGELFYIIENGVRLTGMPAWGTVSSDHTEDTWHLVHFIRHLPKLTADERERMNELNPRSLDEVRQRLEEERFLKGGDVSVPAAPATGHAH